MNTRSVRNRTTGALRLVAALGGLATPPLLLATIVGNPLPSWPIDWTLVVESIQAGLVPSSVWVNVLAVVAWAAWAVLLAMLSAEVIAVVRNRPSAPAVPAWIRHLAQALVAAAIALAGPGQQPVAAAVGGASFVAAAAPMAPSGPTSPVDAEPAVEGRLVTVGEGDSWGGFAGDVLGDASLGPQLREANLGRHVGDGQTVTESTAFVEPGWQLVIPTNLDGGVRVAQSADTAAPDDEAETGEAGTWDVAEGDHFWAIAEQTLQDAWGRVPTDTEVAPYWRDLVEANRERLLPPDDPDLVYPGQQFVVPTPPTDPEATPPPAADTPAQDGWRAAIKGHDHVGGPEPEPAPGTDGWAQALDPPAAQGDVGEGPQSALDEEPRNGFGLPVGLAGGAAAASLLAAGAVATLRWRRRTAMQLRPPGLRLPTPLPDAEVEEARLAAAAPPDVVLDDLAAMLASIPADTHPVLVTAGDSGEVTLLFDERDELPDPPAPWSLAYDGSDGPVGWRATLGDGGPERSIGLPLLVTLGRTGTANVLANVAAMGTLALAGDAAQVRRRQRAMSLEVATSRVSVPVEVAVAGDDRLSTLDRVRHIDDPSHEIELSMDEIEQDIVLDDRTPRLLACHDSVEPPAMPSELRGMVGVLAAAPTEGAWLVDLDDEHTGRLHLPGGGTVTLTLPDVDPDLIDDELTRLTEPPTEPVAPTEPTVAAEPSNNGHPPAPVVVSPQPAWCEVRILGPIEVVADGRKVEGLTPTLLEVFTYLATHDGVSKERLEAAVWADQDASPGTQRVKSALFKIRGVLGDGPDGQPLLPHRSGDELVKLSEHVGCDLDRALAHLDLAKDLPAQARARELAAAVDLVRGEPFQGQAYSWSTDLSRQAIVKLQDAAVEAARTLREAGDLGEAEAVIARGHKLLDGNGWLYLEQAELEMARGHPERASFVYEQYRRTLGDDADEIAGTVASPPLELDMAFREVLAAS